jgi:hypothetical protein
MLRKIKSLLIVSAGSILMFTPVLAIPAFASAANIDSSLCSGTNLQINTSGAGATNCGNQLSDSTLQTILDYVVNIFSVIVGVVAVIMLIVGGFKYITSGGNDQGVAGAKNTIVYALIGLVVVALAQVIVHFVIAHFTTPVLNAPSS